MFVSGFTRMIFIIRTTMFFLITIVKCYRRCALLIKYVIKFTESRAVALQSIVLLFQRFAVNRMSFVINCSVFYLVKLCSSAGKVMGFRQ